MFPISDLPPEMPLNEVRVYCSVEAAIHYDMAADLIYAVSLNEGGKSDSKVKNTNGTFDLGFMQFNTAYLKTLQKDGITKDDVMKSNCYPFHLAAWRIKQHINENTGDDLLSKVAYYHSRTPVYNARYRQKLEENVQKFPLDLASSYFDLIIERLKSFYATPVEENYQITHLNGEKTVLLSKN